MGNLSVICNQMLSIVRKCCFYYMLVMKVNKSSHIQVRQEKGRTNINRLASVYLFSKVDKKAMIRNRYNRIPHPALNTKRVYNST